MGKREDHKLHAQVLGNVLWRLKYTVHTPSIWEGVFAVCIVRHDRKGEVQLDMRNGGKEVKLKGDEQGWKN
jgi:hypothetical protein